MNKFKVLILPFLMIFSLSLFLIFTKNIRKENIKKYKKNIHENVDYNFVDKEKGLSCFLMSMYFTKSPSKYIDGEINYTSSNLIAICKIEFIFLLILTIISSILSWEIYGSGIDNISFKYIFSLLIIELFVIFVLFFASLQLGFWHIIIMILYLGVSIFIKYETFASTIFMIEPSYVEWAKKQYSIDKNFKRWKMLYNKKLNMNYE